MNSTLERIQNTHPFSLSNGTVWLDATDGTPVMISHPTHPELNFLLSEAENWHNECFRWGKGFLISSAGSARWDAPAKLEWCEDGVDLEYTLTDGIKLEVKRRFGETWLESYHLTNTTEDVLEIGSLGISTPFSDMYRVAVTSLACDVSAHIWTGGSNAWVWATPMNARAPGLGLRVTQGELWSYSIETKNTYTSSHNRGHIYLQLTDAARNANALGGQPLIKLNPGESYSLEWTLGFFGSFADFEHSAPPLVSVPAVTTELGASLTLHCRETPSGVSADPWLEIDEQNHRLEVRATRSGIGHVTLEFGTKRERVALFFHAPLREIVEARVAFILEHQQASERMGSRSGAFLPFNNLTNLTVNGGNWLDWADARERIAMPRLLQETRKLGWGDDQKIDAALERFASFADEHLTDAEGHSFENSFDRSPRRLYNFSWLSAFYLERYRMAGQAEYLDAGVRILERFYTLGGDSYLSMEIPECMERAICFLEDTGDHARAVKLKALLIDHAQKFVERGTDLPAHEINYEQSMVAPLCSLLCIAQRFAPRAAFLSAIEERLRWLLAFGGEQPHPRLRHIAIRHWDGYWFGAHRQWGDVFPHYWSVLTATVLHQLPPELQRPEHPELADAIMRANYVNFSDDGRATCAFVFPSCIDSIAAHHADPLANDQDSALMYALQYLKS